MCWQKASACAGSLLESLLRVIFSQAEVCAKTASTGPAAAAAVAAPDQKLPAKRTRIGTPATTRTLKRELWWVSGIDASKAKVI